jgi:hypothetical protein
MPSNTKHPLSQLWLALDLMHVSRLIPLILFILVRGLYTITSPELKNVLDLLTFRR